MPNASHSAQNCQLGATNPSHPKAEASASSQNPRGTWLARAVAVAGLLPSPWAMAQGFDQINTTVLNVQAILILISVAVVTIAIIWAGFKMIFGGARLSEVANVLIGGTLVGGAAAFASYIVT